jgi:hypothetical protein
VYDKLCELSCLLGNLTNAGSSILADLNIEIFEAVKDAREDLSLNHDLSKIDCVLCDLSKARANLSL